MRKDAIECIVKRVVLAVFGTAAVVCGGGKHPQTVGAIALSAPQTDAGRPDPSRWNAMVGYPPSEASPQSGCPSRGARTKAAPSRAIGGNRPYRAVARVSARWTGSDGFAETVARRLTVVRPTAEPICSATTNVVENGEARELTVNPCGVGVGRDAYFRIDVLPRDYPDEKIVWTCAEEGRVAFVGGNRGRAVTVRGVSPGETRLRVQIGECPSDPPWFPLHVVTNRTIHIAAWITRDKFGVPICSTNEVSAMIPTVNDVLAQVGVSVVLDEVVVLDDWDSAKVYYDATNAVEGTWSRQRLFEMAEGVAGLHCFFVDGFMSEDEDANADTLAVWRKDKGIVMTREATALTLAHEIGHELGAGDIYIDWDTLNVRDIPFRMEHAPQDWSNGCHRHCSGYYRRETKLETIIGRLLMNGRERVGQSQGRDMTTGPVYGVAKDGENGYAIGLVPVGFFDFIPNDSEE